MISRQSRVAWLCASVAAVLAVAITTPLWANITQVYLAEQILIFSIVGVGLNVSLGICGQANFGVTPYFALGAYGVINLVLKWNFDPLESLVVVTLVAGIAGLLIGGAILRLKQFTLALGTFVLATAVYEYISVSLPQSLGGGDFGITVPNVKLFGQSLVGNAGYFLSLFALVLVIALVTLIMKTRTGRAWSAIGMDEIAAATNGIRVRYFAIVAYGFSAAVGGLAGGLLAFDVGSVAPQGFSVGVNITILLMVVLGGLGGIVGPIVGAAFISILNQYLASSSYPTLIDGLVLLAVIRFMPGGIVGVVGKLFRALVPARWTHQVSVADAQAGPNSGAPSALQMSEAPNTLEVSE